MKRLLVLILVWTLLVVTGTIVSADGQTRHRPAAAGGKRAAAIGAGGSAGSVLIFTRVTRVASIITDVTS
jgi:hypothetical protein